MPNENLKPCPFCGGEAVIDYNLVYDYWFVYCTGKYCKARFPQFKDRKYTERAKQKAIKAWNKRAGENADA